MTFTPWAPTIGNLPPPLTLANGGTGGTTAGAAFSNLTAGGVTASGSITAPGVLSTGGMNTGGNLDVNVTGAGVQVKEGSNAKQGTATLAAGTVVVANTSVTANSRIFLTCQSLGTVAVPSAYGVSARTAGTSFTILASVNTDTSVIAYEIFEPG